MANARRVWGHWTFMIALSVGCAIACGDDDDDGPVGAAGSSGKGGSGGTAGKGGSSGSGTGGSAGNAGEGGSTAGQGGAGGSVGGAGGTAACIEGEECPEIAYCGPYPLSQLCTATKPCPSLEALEEDECGGPFEKHTQQATTCGQVIVIDYGLGGGDYHFDEAGNLVSVFGRSDAIDVCAEGNGMSGNTLYGAEPCERVGEVTTLCEGGAGGSGGSGAGGAGGSD